MCVSMARLAAKRSLKMALGRLLKIEAMSRGYQ